MKESLARPPVEDWRAELIRITAFAPPDASNEHRSLWAELGLGEPDSFEKKKGKITEQGPALDHWIVVSSAPGRIDMLYIPEPNEPEDVESFVMRDLGSFPKALSDFSQLVDKWIGHKCPNLLRFALGVTVRLPINDRKRGYRQLSAYLPFELDDENSSDFLYQINRRRKSKMVDNLSINRLTKWSVAHVKSLTGRVSLSSREPLPAFRPSSSSHFCRVILDINTDPEVVDELKAGQVQRLLTEFAEMAVEIVTEGDIP